MQCNVSSCTLAVFLFILLLFTRAAVSASWALLSCSLSLLLSIFLLLSFEQIKIWLDLILTCPRQLAYAKRQQRRLKQAHTMLIRKLSLVMQLSCVPDNRTLHLGYVRCWLAKTTTATTTGDITFRPSCAFQSTNMS